MVSSSLTTHNCPCSATNNTFSQRASHFCSHCGGPCVETRVTNNGVGPRSVNNVGVDDGAHRHHVNTPPPPYYPSQTVPSIHYLNNLPPYQRAQLLQQQHYNQNPYYGPGYESFASGHHSPPNTRSRVWVAPHRHVGIGLEEQLEEVMAHQQLGHGNRLALLNRPISGLNPGVRLGHDPAVSHYDPVNVNVNLNTTDANVGSGLVRDGLDHQAGPHGWINHDGCCDGNCCHNGDRCGGHRNRRIHNLADRGVGGHHLEAVAAGAPFEHQHHHHGHITEPLLEGEGMHGPTRLRNFDAVVDDNGNVRMFGNDGAGTWQRTVRLGEGRRW